MTIKQVFEEWAKEPQNKRLASAYRQAFTNVFLKKHAEVDIKDVDLKLTKSIVTESEQPRDEKIRASAALVLVIKHASSKGYCINPGFHTEDYLLLEQKVTVKPEPEATTQQQQATSKPPQATPKPPQATPKKAKKEPKTLKAIMKARREQELGKKRKINKPKAVVQLDPKTYEPIKTYNSAGAAGRAVGSSNILRAVKEHTMSAGYFWAFENEVKDFTPSKLSLTHRAERFKRRKLTPIPAGVTNEDIEAAIEEIDAASEQLREQQEELEAERQEKRHILAEYTDDELLGEIRRREWRGNVIIPVNYEL